MDAVRQKHNNDKLGFMGYVISWVVGLGVFALLIVVALWFVQE